MAIEDRLMDAKFLYDAERFEGALLSALIAAAAASRIRFPQGTLSRKDPSKKMRDGEAFEAFMGEEIRGCRLLFAGECNSTEHILYKWLRCELVHEGSLPADIVFHPGDSPKEVVIERQSGPPERLHITYPVVLLIAHTVASSPEVVARNPSLRKVLVPA